MNFSKSVFSIMALILSANFITAQVQANDDLAFVEHITSTEIEKPKTRPIESNTKDVVKEIRQHLKNNLVFPAEFKEFYNEGVKLTASCKVTESGEIENIVVEDNGNKILGRQVKQELKKLKTVTPVIEDGELVAKNIIVPVVFEL